MKRSLSLELMDDFSIRDDRIDKALRELKIINKFLGGTSTTKSALKYIIGSNDKITIIDIGSGSSDNLISAKNNFPNLKIISLDKNFRVFSSALNSFSKINADGFNLPIKNYSSDIVHIALFLHHFTEAEIKRLLEEFLRISSKGIIINDLQRSSLALIGIKLLTFLFSRSEFVKNDAPLSVKKGFTKKELVKIFLDVGIKNFSIQKKWAFRWMIVIKK